MNQRVISFLSFIIAFITGFGICFPIIENRRYLVDTIYSEPFVIEPLGDNTSPNENFFNYTVEPGVIYQIPEINTNRLWNTLFNHSHYTIWCKPTTGPQRNETTALTVVPNNNGKKQKLTYKFKANYTGSYWLNLTVDWDANSFHYDSTNYTYIVNYIINDEPIQYSYNFSDIAGIPGLSFNGAIVNNKFRFSLKATSVIKNTKIEWDPQIIVDNDISLTTTSTLGTNQRKIVRTSNGVLYAVYYTTRGATNKLQIMLAQSLDNGSTWETKKYQVSPNATGKVNQTNPSILVNSNNELYIFWTGELPGMSSQFIRMRKFYPSNKTFNPIIWNLSRVLPTTNVPTPATIIDSNNNIYLTWTNSTATDSRVLFRRYFYTNNTWGPTWQNVSSATVDMNRFYSVILISPADDSIHIMWDDEKGIAGRFGRMGHRRYWITNNSFSLKYVNSTEIAVDTLQPFTCSAIMDSDGNIHLTWYRDISSTTKVQNIQYKNWWASNNTWRKEQINITEEPTLVQYNPSIYYQSANNSFGIVWYGYHNTSTVVYKIRGVNYSITTGLWSIVKNWTRSGGIAQPNSYNPNSMYATYPNISNVNTNVPLRGVSFIFINESKLSYISSSDLEFGTAHAGANEAPTITLNSGGATKPVLNSSTDVPFQPTVFFWANDTDSANLLVNIYTNGSGIWQHTQKNTTIGMPGTKLHFNYSTATTGGHKYFMNFSIDDGIVNVTGYWFWYRTRYPTAIRNLNQNWNISFQNSTVVWTNLNQNFNISFKNSSSLKSLYNNWNISFKNTSIFNNLKQQWNISFKNSSIQSWKTISQNFNISFKNSSSSTWKNLNQNFNISFRNKTTTWNIIKQNFNISFKNTSILQNIYNNWNISFKNSSIFSWKILKQNFNISFKNSSITFWKTINQNFNISFKNRTASWYSIKQNFNISFSNTSNLKYINQNFNISFKNSSTVSWRIIHQNFNISFKNISTLKNINQDFNISFKNTSIVTLKNIYQNFNVSFKNYTIITNINSNWNISFKNGTISLKTIHQDFNISFKNKTTIWNNINQNFNISFRNTSSLIHIKQNWNVSFKNSSIQLWKNINQNFNISFKNGSISSWKNLNNNWNVSFSNKTTTWNVVKQNFNISFKNYSSLKHIKSNWNISFKNSSTSQWQNIKSNWNISFKNKTSIWNNRNMNWNISFKNLSLLKNIHNNWNISFKNSTITVWQNINQNWNISFKNSSILTWKSLLQDFNISFRNRTSVWNTIEQDFNVSFKNNTNMKNIRNNWNISFKNSSTSNVLVSFIQITDTHIDQGGGSIAPSTPDGRMDDLSTLNLGHLGFLIPKYNNTPPDRTGQSSKFPTLALNATVDYINGNNTNIDFIINTGDLVSQGNFGIGKKDSLNMTKQIFDNMDIPAKYYIGARYHDGVNNTDVKDYYEAFFGQTANWNFTLNNNYFVLISETSSVTPYIDLTYLNKSLKLQADKGYNVVVFMHTSPSSKIYRAESRSNVRAILEWHKTNYTAVVVMSGHSHANDYAIENGVYYVTTTATMNYPIQYRQVDIYSDHIHMYTIEPQSTALNELNYDAEYVMNRIVINKSGIPIPISDPERFYGSKQDSDIYIGTNPVTSVRELNETNKYYNLSNNLLVSTSYGFNVTADYVTLDLGHHFLNGSETNKVLIYVNANNFTLRGDYRMAFIRRSNTAIFVNNSNGFYMENINITNSTRPIFIKKSNSGYMNNITIRDSGQTFLGNGSITFEASTNYTCENITIVNTTCGVAIKSNASYASSDINMIQCNMSLIKSKDISFAHLQEGVPCRRINFTNGSFSETNENLLTGDQLVRKWYIKIHTQYKSNATDFRGVNVSLINESNYVVENVVTHDLPKEYTLGNTSKHLQIIDYVNEGGSKNYYGTYNLYGVKSIYYGVTQYNATTKTKFIQIIQLDIRSWKTAKTNWNVSFKNTVSTKSIYQDFNISFKNSSSLKIIHNNWNISFKNSSSLKSINNNWNISFKNTSLSQYYNLNQNFNISFKNSSIASWKLINQNFNISFRNSSSLKNIESNWNISFKNSSISYLRNINQNWNISFKNSSTTKIIHNNWNVSFKNTSSNKVIHNNWNVSFSNTSLTTWKVLKNNWNISFRNSSVGGSWKNLSQNFNISFSNTTISKNIKSNWNISFRNTSVTEWNDIKNHWNISFRNGSQMSNIFNDWNVSFRNLTTSNWNNINQTFNISFRNISVGPNITFMSQIPADLTSFNCFGRPLNITYNITDSHGIDNASVFIYYKTNKTNSNIDYYINGTAYTGYQQREFYMVNGTNYSFFLRDNQIYPATYNFNEHILENQVHNVKKLNGTNSYLAIELFNVSNSCNYSFFEIMLNSSAGADIMVYYANDSYDFSSNPATNTNVVLFGNVPPLTPYNHTHTVQSSHVVLPFAINTTTNMIGNVKVTPTSYFLIRGANQPQQRPYYHYISNFSRQGATRTTTNNGATWTNRTFTIDAHLHQYNGTDTLWYYIVANNTLGSHNSSTVRHDLINLAGLAPTVVVYTPEANNYSGLLNITYTAESPNSYNIVNYSIRLLNSTGFLLRNLEPNTANTYLVWDTRTIVNETYIIRVLAYDSMGQVGIDISERFNITNEISRYASWNISFRNSSSIHRTRSNWNISFRNTSAINITITNPFPTNGSTDIPRFVTLHVTINNNMPYVMNATWNWTDVSLVFNETISKTYNASNGVIFSFFSNASQYSTTYYWRVNISDGHGNFAQEWYYFTTEAYATGVGGGGGYGYIMYGSVGVIGLIGVLGLLGYIKKRREHD